jgi:hypothetical protein
MSKTTLPHSLEAEQAVLGNLLGKNPLWDDLMILGLTEKDFFRHEHKIIFLTLLKLKKDSIPINIMNIIQTMGNEDANFIGGCAYLTELTVLSESLDLDVIGYAKIVRERSILRQLAAEGSNIEYMSADAIKDYAPGALMVVDDDEARKIMPAWFLERMMNDQWCFALLTVTGHTIFIEKVYSISSDGKWIDAELLTEIPFEFKDHDPKKAILGLKGRERVSIQVPTIVAAYEAAST